MVWCYGTHDQTTMMFLTKPLWCYWPDHYGVPYQTTMEFLIKPLWYPWPNDYDVPDQATVVFLTKPLWNPWPSHYDVPYQNMFSFASIRFFREVKTSTVLFSTSKQDKFWITQLAVWKRKSSSPARNFLVNHLFSVPDWEWKFSTWACYI